MASRGKPTLSLAQKLKIHSLFSLHLSPLLTCPPTYQESRLLAVALLIRVRNAAMEKIVVGEFPDKSWSEGTVYAIRKKHYLAENLHRQ